MKKANKIQATVTSTMLTQLSTGRFPALQTKIVAYVTKKEATRAKWFKIFKIKLLKLKKERKPQQAAEETEGMNVDPISLKLAEAEAEAMPPEGSWPPPLPVQIAEENAGVPTKEPSVDRKPIKQLTNSKEEHLYKPEKEVNDQQLAEPKCECPTDATPENKEFCEMKKRQINFQYPAKFGNRELADLPNISGKEDCFKSSNHPPSVINRKQHRRQQSKTLCKTRSKEPSAKEHEAGTCPY